MYINIKVSSMYLLTLLMYQYCMHWIVFSYIAFYDEYILL